MRHSSNTDHLDTQEFALPEHIYVAYGRTYHYAAGEAHLALFGLRRACPEELSRDITVVKLPRGVCDYAFDQGRLVCAGGEPTHIDFLPPPDTRRGGR